MNVTGIRNWNQERKKGFYSAAWAVHVCKIPLTEWVFLEPHGYLKLSLERSKDNLKGITFAIAIDASVLSTALGLRPRAVLKTSGTVFPNTDLPAGK